MEKPIYNPKSRTCEQAMLDYKKYRSTSTAFIRKARKYILARDKKCMFCGSGENLEIDHIISVYKGYKKKISLYEINNTDNLQVLCRSCNASKLPEM